MIIVLSGGKQHGKDTFAKALQKLYPELQFKRRAFADAIKEITAILLDCDYDEIETLKVLENIKITDESCIRQGTTMRLFLQRLGQLMRDFTGDKLIWAHTLGATMMSLDSNYIVTDCRFGFEERYLRELAEHEGQQVVVVKILNPRVELGKDTHVSERSYEEIRFDEVILNTGSFEDLEYKAIELMKNLGEI